MHPQPKPLTETEMGLSVPVKTCQEQLDGIKAAHQAEISTLKKEQAAELAALRASYEEKMRALAPAGFLQRVDDLTEIQKALTAFHRDWGNYPKRSSWSGIYSYWGLSSRSWIPGLVPDYLDALPRDPRNHQDPQEQYVYTSDGEDYKLLSVNPGDCDIWKKLFPEMIDPRRGCEAVGFWSQGAADW